jgi:hypothetical protein
MGVVGARKEFVTVWMGLIPLIFRGGLEHKGQAFGKMGFLGGCLFFVLHFQSSHSR